MSWYCFLKISFSIYQYFDLFICVSFNVDCYLVCKCLFIWILDPSGFAMDKGLVYKVLCHWIFNPSEPVMDIDSVSSLTFCLQLVNDLC